LILTSACSVPVPGIAGQAEVRIKFIFKERWAVKRNRVSNGFSHRQVSLWVRVPRETGRGLNLARQGLDVGYEFAHPRIGVVMRERPLDPRPDFGSDAAIGFVREPFEPRAHLAVERNADLRVSAHFSTGVIVCCNCRLSSV